MSEPYQEILGGKTIVRSGPGVRHELICSRVHQAIRASVANLAGTRLLDPRARVQLALGTVVCPDLALVTVATGKLWLAVEVVSSDDHRTDTVVKKEIYEQWKLPRLWMIDPRYDNLEVYHSSEYGLRLHSILAGSEVLVEKLLPEFQLTVSELFRATSPGGHS